MTTYSFIQYDVLNNLMSFKGTPTPGLKTLIEDNNSDISSIRDILQNDQYADDTLVPTTASVAIIDFLETVTEIDLNNSKTIILTIPIIDDVEMGDGVKIVSKNIDGTKTYVTKGKFDLAVEYIKPGKKWKTMGKCTNCLKFYFNEFNEYNFTGNLGGVWNGTFKNGQKVYEFYLPDYSSPIGYGAEELYKIYWKPNITYTGTDYNGNPISIVNQNKWIATPASTMDVLNDKTFFHVLNNTAAPCPYAPAPLWYNFFGNKGFFLLNAAQSFINKPCPVFKPHPGDVVWGFNCGPNGCVEAPSGSATWSTLEQCQVSCSLTPTVSGSYGYNCISGDCIEAPSGSTPQYSTLLQCEASCSSPTPVTSSWYSCTSNGCVQVPSGSAGAVATLAECETYCIPIISVPTSCSCDPDLNIVTNSDFSQGSTNWTYSPLNYTPGIGSFNFSQGYAAPSVEATMSLTGTSSVYLTQPNLFNLSCSYNVCFQAWVGFPVDNALISVDNGNNVTQGTGPLTTTPTAYSFTLNNVATNDLTFFCGMGVTGSNARMNIDNVCVTLIGCPPVLPPPTGSEVTGSTPPTDCYITGSIYSYTTASYDCLCPEGYVSDGNGNCTDNATQNIVSANAGLYTPSNISQSYIGWPQGNGNIIPGFSINQPSTLHTIDPTNVSGYIPAMVGMAQPILYYSWSFNGAGYSSTSSISPFEGSNKVYNTQYTFDVLKNDFWYQPDLGQNWTARWVAQLARQTTMGIPGGGFTGNDRWSGMGTTINVPSPKTYYVGIIGQGAMKIKLDGTTILCTSPSETNTPIYYQTDYPAYAQNGYARYPEFPYGLYNWGTLQAPFYSFNNFITASISSSYFDFYFQNAGPEYAFVDPPNVVFGNGKFLPQYNLYIYPVTMSAGCHQINIEANPDNFKYCISTQGFLGGIILDNTAEQLVSASNYNDLNIVWDSTYLDPITSSFLGYAGNNPITESYYLYTYDVATIPPSSSYTSWCPSGSIPVSGSPCNGCLKSGSINSTIPCGNCLECTHGLLYNGYAVDKGSATLQGRGPGGIVNTSISNATTWVVPTESDWNNLVTFLNGGTAPISVTTTGSLGTIAGGKMKDYTRDLEATCWESPNLGAQTNASSSGWAGTAGGRRKNDGVFEGLGFEGLWWSANSVPTNGALMATRRLEHYSPDVYRDIFTKNYGCSVRLVRPAVTGEINGMFIPDAYVGKNGTLYDGIVINDQVWITKNLSETLYNDNTSITTTTPNNTWSSTQALATATSCFYGNDSNNTNILNGNINPVTQDCYTFPTYYVYQKCDGTEFLVQTVPGSTTTVGDVQKDSNGDCWSFYQVSAGLPTFTYTSYTGNYFSGSNVVYDNCSECEAIHTIYMKFGTKNC